MAWNLIALGCMDTRELTVLIVLTSGVLGGCSSDSPTGQAAMSAGSGAVTSDASAGSGGVRPDNSLSMLGAGRGVAGEEASAGAGGVAVGPGGAGGSAGAGSGGASAPTFQPEWLACAAAEDCVVVQSNGCCGCADMAVNRLYQTEARAAWNSVDLSKCGPVGCATTGCQADARAGCNAGSCVPLPGCSQRPPTEYGCETDGTCKLYGVRLCQNGAAAWSPLCGSLSESAACDSTPTCRVDPGNGIMLLFEDGCVPLGWEQACPVACE